MNRILIIEDDKALRLGLCFDLEEENYLVTSADTLQKARIILSEQKFDLIVLDVNLPDGDGLDFCKEIKEKLSVPIIFLTACDMETDELSGFEAGADDYVTKPFSTALLRKRISAVIRRYSDAASKNIYDDGFLSINFDNLGASRNGETIFLTPTEYKLIKIFTANKGRVLTRQLLLEKMWDNDGNFVDEHALTVNINRLRNKIENDKKEYIRTVYGIGYMWTGENNG